MIFNYKYSNIFKLKECFNSSSVKPQKDLPSFHQPRIAFHRTLYIINQCYSAVKISYRFNPFKPVCFSSANPLSSL